VPKPPCPQRNSRTSWCRGLEDQTPQRSRSAHLPATGWRARLGRGGAMAVCSVFCHVPPGTMPIQSQDSPLGAFLKALREEKIDCILIGAMAAIEQGAPLMTVDYDFWVRLPERQYVRLLTIVHRQAGTIRARTVYELSDGTQ